MDHMQVNWAKGLVSVLYVSMTLNRIDSRCTSRAQSGAVILVVLLSAAAHTDLEQARHFELPLRDRA